MKKILKLIALSAFLLMLAGVVVSCRDNEKETPCECEDKEIFTGFFTVGRLTDEKFEHCVGRPLLTGCRGYLQWRTFWAKNLPEDYQPGGGCLIITFCHTGEYCIIFPQEGMYFFEEKMPVIYILNIERQ